MNTLERLRYLANVEKWDGEGFYIDRYSVSQTDLKKLLAVVEAARACQSWCRNTLMGQQLDDALAALEGEG